MFQKQDPDYVGFSGTLKTDLRIGNDALVEVEATYDDDECRDLIVMYRGADIVDAIGDSETMSIHQHISKHWQKLVQQSTKDRDYDEQ